VNLKGRRLKGGGGGFRVRALDELEIQGRSKNIKDCT
jgi:hypothetical protein